MRGYLEVAALGDDSVTGGLEVFTPNYANYLINGLDEFRLLAFIDGGIVRVQKPLPGQRTGLNWRVQGWLPPQRMEGLRDVSWLSRLKGR